MKYQNPFYFLYTMTLLKILSEPKKYRINLIIFHDKLLNNQIRQYIYIYIYIIGVKCSKFEISFKMSEFFRNNKVYIDLVSHETQNHE
jgi:hypothetical protein